MCEFPVQRASNTDFDAFFGVSLKRRLTKQSRGGDLRRHYGYCEVTVMYMAKLW